MTPQVSWCDYWWANTPLFRLVSSTQVSFFTLKIHGLVCIESDHAHSWGWHLSSETYNSIDTVASIEDNFVEPASVTIQTEKSEPTHHCPFQKRTLNNRRKSGKWTLTLSANPWKIAAPCLRLQVRRCCSRNGMLYREWVAVFGGMDGVWLFFFCLFYLSDVGRSFLATCLIDQGAQLWRSRRNGLDFRESGRPLWEASSVVLSQTNRFRATGMR